jgi:hypothetical protein
MSERLLRLGPPCALLAAAAAALLGLWHGVHGWPDLTTNVRDDAYYEFTWAWHLAHGDGPTVSAGTTTSGVQYLWALLLVPFAALGDGGALPDVAIALGVLCHVLGAASWIVAARGRPAGWCLALLWLGNPLLLRECQNGQETALACLCAALLWHLRAARERWFAPLALLAVLARSDLFAAVLLLSLVRHGRRWWRGLWAPLAVLALHLLVNRALGGGWMQDSALPMAWLFHANFAATAPSAVDWLRQQWWFMRPALLGGPFALVSAPLLGVATWLCLRPLLPPRIRLFPLQAVVAAALLGAHDLAVPAVAALLLAALPRRRGRPVPRALLAFAVGLAGIVALHWSVRWYPRDYYAAPLAAAGVAALQRVRRSWWLLALAAGAEAATADRAPLEALAGQATMALAAERLADVVAPPQPIGMFNSGILAFTHRHRRGEAGFDVVDLDGVVDARALAALQRQALGAFLVERNVRLVIDSPREFELDPRLPHASGRWFAPAFDPARDLVELGRFLVPGATRSDASTSSLSIHVYALEGPPPALPDAPPFAPWCDGFAVVWNAAGGAVLDAEQRDGSRRELARAEIATRWVLGLRRAELGSGRLFERGREAPLVELPVPPR